MADRIALQRLAVDTRVRAPTEWDAFMGGLRLHLADAMDALVSAPVETALVVQGRCQGLRALIQLLESAPDAVAKAKDKEKARPTP